MKIISVELMFRTEVLERMDNKIFILFALMFIFISFASAENDQLEIEFGQQGVISIVCDDQTFGSSCNSGVSCNLTSLYPNGSTWINNQVMTNNNGLFQYTIAGSNTQVIGTYDTVAQCFTSLVSGKTTFPVLITPTGDSRSFSLMLILAIGALILLILGLYFHDSTMILISGLLFLVAGVYTMIYGFNDMNDLYTKSIALIAIGLGAYFTIASAYNAYQTVFGEEDD